MIYDASGALIKTEINGLRLLNRGKVRDVYDLGESLLFIATDRISAFDCVMPNGIPHKGRVLTQLSLFWFEYMNWLPNHLITADPEKFPESLAQYKSDLAGRSIIVKKAKPLPVECVVRGYLVGSGWKDYQREGKVCGINLRAGYHQAEKLDQPLFTPTTKAEQGHDEAISFEQVEELIGSDVARTVRDLAIKVYTTAADCAAAKGVIVADTKFEFGIFDGKVILIDEVLTPDSSRFWPAAQYKLDCNPPSLDKQFVRDYLESLNWDKNPPAPELPADIVKKTIEKYIGAYEAITGKNLSFS